MTPLRILGKVPNSFTFALATGIGILLGLMFHTQLWTSHSLQRTSVTADKTSHSHWYKLWLQKYNLFQINENMNFSGQVMPEAKYLMHRIKIFCWVKYDQASSHSKSTNFYPTEETFYKTIMATWGRKCTKIVFFTNRASDNLNEEHFVLLNTNDLQSWFSSYKSIQTICEKYNLYDYDWFLKVEEDTFIIMENLLYFLAVFDSTLPYYFGYLYGSTASLIYNVAGPGTVLSQAAMKRLYSATKTGLCIPSYEFEDAALARCLQKLGVRCSDTRDSLGRNRFLMYVPETHIIDGGIAWFDNIRRQSYFEIKQFTRPDAPFLSTKIIRSSLMAILMILADLLLLLLNLESECDSIFSEGLLNVG